MTKIAVLLTNSTNTSYGGVGPFVKNLDVYLAEHYELQYFALPDYFENVTLVPHRLMYFLYVLSNFFKLRNYDMIISHAPESAYACSICGFQFVHIFHGNDNPVSMSRFWYGKYFISFFDHMTKVISKNSLICYTVGKEEIGRKKLLNPIAHNISVKDASERSGFIFAGRLEKGKRVERLLESYALLPVAVRDVNMMKIGGKGSQFEFLQEKVKSLGLDKNVQFLGNLDNLSLIDQISRSNILLMASGFEGFPMVIAEAFSVGVPVISTNVGDIAGFLKSGENGELVIKDFEYKDFADAIGKVLYKYEHYSHNALKSGEVFDAKKITKDLVTDIDSFIKQN
jgi:glycosyltransferase involved in cell wall biosynthesis